MTDRIKPLRAIVAPDFAFESADRPQESLTGNCVVKQPCCWSSTCCRNRAAAARALADAAYAAAGAR
jgi:hypothetical protein